jgi:Flp pilus assembly CpaF family ATPase
MLAIIHADDTRTDLSGLKPGESILLGSILAADIRLFADGILPRHARIENDNGLYVIRPVEPKNPVFVNGEYVMSDGHPLVNGDTIQLGEWIMRFEDSSSAGQEAASAGFSSRRRGEAPGGERERIKRALHASLIDRMNLRGLDGNAGPELRLRTDRFITALLEENRAEIETAGLDPAQLHRELMQMALGFGQLDDLIADTTISEIMCLGDGRIYVERKGKIVLSDHHFDDIAELRGIIDRIVGPIGRRIDESSPIVDARLPDGSRVNAVIEPVAIDGPTLDIRKFTANRLGIEDLIRGGSMIPEMAAFLELAVRYRQNIIVSGGTGSGKTTLLNILSGFIPADERIVTIEDSAELSLRQDHVVRLESRAANIEGKGEIPIRALVKNALRMRPDRIVVGECRGGEALDMLQAMNTGHDGSLTTLHANSPRDVVSRLETLSMMGGLELPERAIRQQIASAVNLVCHQARLADGSRRITSIAEVVPSADGENLSLRDVFRYKRTGIEKGTGRILGHHVYTGAVPQFVRLLAEAGIPYDESMFALPADDPAGAAPKES